MASEDAVRDRGTPLDVFLTFLLLGLTSFGGPVAHLGYFRESFVVRRKWLTESAYADLVALCQFLPGPASSQAGMAIGLMRAGLPGMAAAWIGFTLPSAIAMAGFAYGFSVLGAGGWVDGLKAAAVAVVAQAVLGMLGSLAPDAKRATMAAGAMIVVLLVAGTAGQILAMAAGAAAGLIWLRQGQPANAPDMMRIDVARPVAIGALALFALLLFGLPLLAGSDAVVALFDRFYRAGALVFGGGHVVLPLLESAVVDDGLVERTAFLAGYGAAQAVPGPLFSFAAFLGMVAVPGGGPASAAVAIVAIFLPSALLIVGVLPFWAALRRSPAARAALTGINAAVVGLLGAALYDPVFTEGIRSPTALAVALAAFVALAVWRVPAWAVVVSAGAVGFAVL